MTLYLTVSRGYTATTAGLVLSVYGIGSAVGVLLGGELTDRVGRRATMVGAQLAAAATTAALGLVTQVAAIAALTFAVGATASASRPAVAAMIADLVGPADRLRAYAVNYWAINIGFGLSAVVAGFIAQHGYVWLFVGDAATTLACAILMWVKLAETRPVGGGPRTVQSVRGPARAAPAGLTRVLRDLRFLALTGLAFALWVIFYQGSTSLPIVMADHGLDSRAYGLVIGINGLLIVALQIPVTGLAKERSRSRSLAAAALLIGGGFGLTGLAGGSTALYAVAVAVWTVGEIVYAPASSAVVADLAPDDARGRYQGVFAFGTAAATCVAPVLGGVILDHGGASVLWEGCAVLGAVTAAAFLLLLAGRRGQAAPPPGREQADRPAVVHVPGPDRTDRPAAGLSAADDTR
jgi:MFS family permease